MKILLISHTCFSTYNNMGKTFLALFSSFRREELCQLYIYPSLPDADVCGSYYRVTDKDMLKSLVMPGCHGGPLDLTGVTFGIPAALENPGDSAIYQQKRNSSAVARLGRDALWKLGRWYTPRLRRWVEEQRPDCIFLAPGYAELIYDIALRISREYGLPIVSYLCDDYYFVREPGDLAGRLQLKRLRRKTDALMARTDCLVTICEEMKEAYVRRFGLPARVIMTGSDRKPAQVRPEARSVCYFGNLSVNREKALAEIARALDSINGKTGSCWQLELYTPTLEPQTRQLLERSRCVRLRSFVTGAAFDDAMAGARLLIHAEAFDGDAVDLIKHSVSTKIPESLAAGIPLLAYGPGDIASMAHLIRRGCAFTAVGRDQLEQVLRTALTDDAARAQVLERAKRTLAECHHQQANSRMLKQIFEEIHERATENGACAAAQLP